MKEGWRSDKKGMGGTEGRSGDVKEGRKEGGNVKEETEACEGRKEGTGL